MNPNVAQMIMYYIMYDRFYIPTKYMIARNIILGTYVL